METTSKRPIGSPSSTVTVECGTAPDPTMVNRPQTKLPEGTNRQKALVLTIQSCSKDVEL